MLYLKHQNQIIGVQMAGIVEKLLTGGIRYGAKRALRLNPEKQFSPEEMDKLVQDNRDSLGLGEGLKCKDAVGNFMKGDFSGFSLKMDVDEEGKKGTTLAKKLNTAKDKDEATRVKERFKKATSVFSSEKDSEDIAISDEFAMNIEAINHIILNNPSQFSAEAYASQLSVLKAEEEAHFKARHDQRKANVDALFKDENFIADLKTALGLNDDGIEDFKKNYLEEIDKSHKEALSQFSKEINNDINSLHKANADEFHRLATILKHYNENKKIREYIDNQLETEGVSIEINGIDDAVAKFKNIKMEDLIKTGALKTTGSWSLLQANIREMPDGSVGIRLNRLFQMDDSVYEELTSLCEIVKATGAETIELNIEHKDPEQADELMRKFVESATRAGFAPDKIKATVNGEVKYAYDSKEKAMKDELFKDSHAVRLSVAKDFYNKRETSLDNILGKNKSDNVDKDAKAHPDLPGMKKAIGDAREIVKQNAAAEKEKEAKAAVDGPKVK